MRDLTRAREDAICVERRARQRTVAFLLRHGRVYPGKPPGAGAIGPGSCNKSWTTRPSRSSSRNTWTAVREASARVLRLTGQFRDLVPQWRQAPFVAAYQALRGVSLIVAATVMAEVGALEQFNNPKELMAYLGLVPSEHSSGASVRRGRITKTGNSHPRRVLVEAAWAYRLQARVTRHLLKRRRACRSASGNSPGRRSSGSAPVIAAFWPGARPGKPLSSPWPATGGLSLGYWPGCGTRNCLKTKIKSKGAV